MQLQAATHEHHWREASGLLTSVSDTLRGNGCELWRPGQLTVEALKAQYRLHELHRFVVDAEVIGVVFLQDEDKYYWPEIKGRDTLFFHKLGLKPALWGQGIGDRMLGLIEDRARERGKSWVRLDCDDRSVLRAFYESHGFRFVDALRKGEFNVVRYQLPLTG